jgi:hypothetical protein
MNVKLDLNTARVGFGYIMETANKILETIGFEIYANGHSVGWHNIKTGQLFDTFGNVLERNGEVGQFILRHVPTA